MSRNPARSRQAPVATTQHLAPTAAPTAPEPMTDAWQRTLDFSRAMLGATLGSQQEWVRGLGDWQEAQARSLRKASARIEQLAAQTEHAPDWPALWALQAHLAGSQWTQAMQDSSALIERAMQIESRWVERSRADATRLSQRWRPDLNRVAGGARGDTEADMPMAFAGQAQATMNEMSRLWTQVLYNTRLPD